MVRWVAGEKVPASARPTRCVSLDAVAGGKGEGPPAGELVGPSGAVGSGGVGSRLPSAAFAASATGQRVASLPRGGTKKPRRVRAGLRGLVMVTGCEPGIPGFCSECGGTLAAASRRGIPPAGVTPNMRIACAFTIAPSFRLSRPPVLPGYCLTACAASRSRTVSFHRSRRTSRSRTGLSGAPTRRTDGSLRRKIYIPRGKVKPLLRISFSRHG